MSTFSHLKYICGMYKIWLLMMTGNGFPVGLHPYCRLRRPNKKQAVRQNSPLLFFHFFLCVLIARLSALCTCMWQKCWVILRNQARTCRGNRDMSCAYKHSIFVSNRQNLRLSKLTSKNRNSIGAVGTQGASKFKPTLLFLVAWTKYPASSSLLRLGSRFPWFRVQISSSVPLQCRVWDITSCGVTLTSNPLSIILFDILYSSSVPN